jgi:thiosulfate dehydrogenase [quinone] large subunit
MAPTTSAISFDRQLAYVVFRLSLGINGLIHGSGRIFGAGAEAFASNTMGEFEATSLPYGLTHTFLLTLPLVEMVLGTLITVGLFTRGALTLGGLLITALIFGTALRSDWATVGIQMIYSITYYQLLVNRTDNRFSVDALLRRTHRSRAGYKGSQL